MGERAVAAGVSFGLSLAVGSLIEDWHEMLPGGQAMLSGSWLHVYADHPGIQVGPLGLLALGVLHYEWLGRLAVALLLIPALRLATQGASRRFSVAASAVMALSWTWLGISGHLEDALAIVALLAAVRARSRWQATGWVVVAAAAKPWAACALPLLLGWGWLTALAGGVGIAAVYLPFLLQPGALAASRVTFLAEKASLVGVLFPTGADQYHTLPGVYRMAQLVLVAAAVTIAVRHRAVWAVPAVLVGVRVFLDPGTWHYYYPPLALALLLIDVRRANRLPWLAAAAALLGLTSNSASTLVGGARLLVLLVVLVAALLPSGRAVVRRDAGARQRRAVDRHLVQHPVEVDATPRRVPAAAHVGGLSGVAGT